MDVSVRIQTFKDGLDSAEKRVKKIKTSEDKGLHREQMKFLERQFEIIKKEVEEYLERQRKLCE
jgi:hypothetical protein